MNYDLLEKAIVQRLEPLKGLGFEVVQLPETNDMQRAFKYGRVTVAYLSSEFNDDGFNGKPMIYSTAEIVQKETALIEVVLEARTRMGAGGLHALGERVRRRLVGHRPESWHRLYLREGRYVLPDEQSDGVWRYAMTFQCNALLVEEPDEVVAPLLTQITFDEVFGGDQTVVDNDPAITEAPLRFKEGTTISVQYELTENGQPKDLTGYTFRWGIKQFLNDDVALVEVTPTVAGHIVSALVPAVDNVLLVANYYAILEMVSGGGIENEIVFTLIIEPQIL